LKIKFKSVNWLRQLVFVGLGLHSERGISLHGIDEVKTAHAVFAEFYTSLMPELSISKLEKLAGKRINVLTRRDLEEDLGNKILEAAEKEKVVFLVPGDPLMATTHVDLRIRAEKQGIETKLVHGASIISAVIGLSGLQNYKYGRSVTVPFSEQGQQIIETPYNVIKANKKMGLHTLCFLDFKPEEERYMTVKEGLEVLLKVEKQQNGRIVTMKTLAVGIARAGSNASIVKADCVRKLLKFDFGTVPHSIVFPGKLHFMEAKALIVLAKAPETVRRMIK
jgi:diphthine synthase